MTVGFAWQNWDETAGGGFTFVTEVLRTISANKASYPWSSALVILDDSTPPADVQFERTLRVDTKPSKIKRQPTVFSKLLGRTRRVGASVEKTTFEGKDLSEKIDILVFVYPGFLRDANVPQMSVIWDLGHRYLPVFPEISHGGVRSHRENFFRDLFANADRIVVGTQRGAEEAQQYYGYERNNIGIVPHPTPSIDNTSVMALSDKWSIPAGPFALYPAQFWAHKNHTTLLKAWYELANARSIPPKLILTGRDYGNEKWLKEKASQMGLNHLVEFRGFVSRQELVALYRAASVLVYPSLFGPENLPPLEAMSLGCPVIVTEYPGAREQFGDAVIYADPFDPKRWAELILNVHTNDALRETLIQRGKHRAESFTVDRFTSQFVNEISTLLLYRGLWPTVSC